MLYEISSKELYRKVQKENILVMALTMYMRKTKFKGHYRLEPLDGKLYAITVKEVEAPVAETMIFDLYGEY